jgi:hypothetical protein
MVRKLALCALLLSVTACGFRQKPVYSEQKTIEVKPQSVSMERKENPEIKLTTPFSKLNSGRLKDALGKLQFFTRDKNTDDMHDVYFYIGDYPMSLYDLTLTIKDKNDECKRASAYYGLDLKDRCEKSLAKGISDFADVIYSNKITPQEKRGALIDSRYNNGDIDFEHFSRLAIMHRKLCLDKGGTGYVTMINTAVPCQ